MNPKASKSIFRYFTFIVFMTAAAVSGCTAYQTKNDPGLEPAPLPQYKEGTIFVYSDGTWETVILATPDQVTWQNHRGDSSTGSPDFTFRRAEWQTRKRRGERSFSPRSDLTLRPDISLWPLAAGRTSGYREDGQWWDSKGMQKTYTSIWRCEVAGTARVSVLAGQFNTWKIVCRRYSANSSGAARRIKEVKTWYYAPDIGHPVLTTSRYTYSRPSRRVELMAIIPPQNELPPAARAEMKLSLQQSLESNMRGKPARWEISNQGLSGQTVPRDTFKMDNGVFCRRYIQKIQLVEETRSYYGMACRNPDGEWSVPRR